MIDRESLAVARRAFGAHLIRWPEVVRAWGEEGAAVRLDAWAARVAKLERENYDASVG
jgi:hypothetical protein